MAIVITNPETGQKHEMDEAALSELRDAIAYAENADRGEAVFRAMRIDVATAKSIVEAE